MDNCESSTLSIQEIKAAGKWKFELFLKDGSVSALIFMREDILIPFKPLVILGLCLSRIIHE